MTSTTDLIERLKAEADIQEEWAEEGEATVVGLGPYLMREAITALSPVLPDATDLIERLDKLSNHGQTQEDYKTIQEAITALSPVLPDATAVNTLGELQQEIERLQADNADKSQLLARFKGRIDEYEQALTNAIETLDLCGEHEEARNYEKQLTRIRGMK